MKSKTKEKIKELSASEITQQTLKILSLQGYEVWRSNNLAVKGRKFIGRKGVGDITGYCKKTGRRLECEVKKIGDTMKEEQHEFLMGILKAGGIALVARQQGREVVIEPYEPIKGKAIGL